jgi:hypothetical protein
MYLVRDLRRSVWSGADDSGGTTALARHPYLACNQRSRSIPTLELELESLRAIRMDQQDWWPSVLGLTIELHGLATIFRRPNRSLCYVNFALIVAPFAQQSAKVLQLNTYSLCL